MTATTHITVGIAFLAGLVSFVSPCVLPLVPAYLSLLTGESLENLTTATRHARARNCWRTRLAFVTGFSAIFVALGLSASAIGGVLDDKSRPHRADRRRARRDLGPAHDGNAPNPLR